MFVLITREQLNDKLFPVQQQFLSTKWLIVVLVYALFRFWGYMKTYSIVSLLYALE